jgi:hypothetical protein
MIILGDSNITAATISATNVTSSIQRDKLKTFTLANQMRTTSGSTVIDLDFGTVSAPDVSMLGLCGTNLTQTAVIQVSYSDTNIAVPDATILLDPFSSFNQIMILPALLNKRYWRISISDAALTEIWLGYLYIGKYLNIPYIEFGHNSSLQLNSNPNVNSTGQGYGGKLYNSMPVSFTMFAYLETVQEYIRIKQVKQNIDPVLIVEFPSSYDIDIYRPKYGVLTGDLTFPITQNNLTYSVSDTFEERF